MNKLIRFTLIPLILTTFGTAPAQADDEALAAIGGFVAGIITGAVIDDHDNRSHVYIGRDRYSDRHGSRHHDYRDRCCSRDCHGACSYGQPSRHYKKGHWEIKHVRVWVPGRWTVKYNSCGDRIKVWKRGHYRWEKERVWVSYNKRDGCRNGYKG